MTLVFQVFLILLCGQRVVLYFIVGEIQDGRHLTRSRSNKIRVKQFFI